MENNPWGSTNNFISTGGASTPVLSSATAGGANSTDCVAAIEATTPIPKSRREEGVASSRSEGLLGIICDGTDSIGANAEAEDISSERAEKVVVVCIFMFRRRISRWLYALWMQ